MASGQWSVISKPTSTRGVVFASVAKRLTSRQPKGATLLFRLIAGSSLLLAVTTQLAAAQNPAGMAHSVVVLDAAHGGDDAGAGLGGEPEKNFTLEMSVRLRSLLAARGFQVVTTREADTTVDMARRAEIANHAGAMACLSIHATEAGSGVHIFVSSLSPAGPARFTAFKTAQAAWVTRSLTLAGVVNSALTHAGTGVTLGRVGLPSLDSMACPAVAVEIAPQRTADAPGSTSLDDPGVRAHIAEALAAALVEWRSAGRGAREP